MDYKTKYENIIVCITEKKKGEKTILTGVLKDCETNRKVKGIKPVTRSTKFSTDIESLKSNIKTILENQYVSIINNEIRKKNGTNSEVSEMRKVFNKLVADRFTINKWAASTQKAAISYFKINTLPKIENIIVEDDIPEDFPYNLLCEFAAKSQGSKKSKNVYDKENAKNHLYEADVIYKVMRDYNGDLPNLSFVIYDKVSGCRIEQLKTLSEDIMEKFNNETENMIGTDPKLARAIVLMDSCALRPAEAAAVIKNDFKSFDNNFIIHIYCEEENGLRCNRVKTKYSDRIVVVDDRASDIIRRCNKMITDDNELTPVSAKKLSNIVKDLLVKCGCTQEYIEESKSFLYNNLDYLSEIGNGAYKIDSVCAYILRRNRASVWKNICGLSDEEIDCLLGHKGLSRIDNTKFTNSENIRDMIIKLRRFKLNRLVKDGMDSSFIELEVGKTENLIEQNGYDFHNNSNETIDVFFTITTSEPGECPMFYFKKENNFILQRKISTPNLGNCLRKNRDIIG